MDQKPRLGDRLIPPLLIAAAYGWWLAVALVAAWLIISEVRSILTARD
jgi:hypothetical protein